MVKIGLKISCTFENINELYVPGPDFQWNLKLQCRNCNETDENWHAISESDSVEGKSGPGSFNFQMKCKFCSNLSTIDIVKDSVKRLKCDDSGKISKQTAIIFDCRGIEPVEFDPQGGWSAKSEETGTEFTDIDFSGDTMWAGYDEKGKCPVSIDDLTSEFARV